MASRLDADNRLSLAAFGANAREWGILSDLIGRIYECAIDPERWDDTLFQLASVLGPPDWEVVLLLWEKLKPPGGHFVGAAGLVPFARQIYLSAFIGRTPWSRRIAPQPVGRVFETDEIMPRDEHTRDDFYQSFLKTWRMEIAVGMVLDRRGPERLGLLMPGPPDHDLTLLKRGLRLLAPHLQRAVRISRALGEVSLRAAAAELALERAPVAIVMLTPGLGVVTTNAKLLALGEEGWLKIDHGQFGFRDPLAQARLAELAASQASTSAAFQIRHADGRSLAVLGARLPTQIARTLAGPIEGMGIVLSIGVGNTAPLLEIDRLRAWFGLTPAEARLTAALAAGGSLADFAARRGVSMSAVRFLLKGVYRKTGAGSQADLVVRVRNLPAG